ncbi:MAG: hypothetical protein ACE5EQ_06605 [Phycisphaerae bacterium]
MSNNPAKEGSGRCAVRGPENDPERAALMAYLDVNGQTETVHFLPKDDDDLNAELCAGHFDRVIFPSFETLLTAIWDGNARIDRWKTLGVQIEIADDNGTDMQHRLEALPLIADSLTYWRSKRRRRKIIASLILSTIALIATAILLFLIPPAR